MALSRSAAIKSAELVTDLPGLFISSELPTLCRTAATAPVEAGEGLIRRTYRGLLLQDTTDRRSRPLP
jgi:hypothetical protein